MDGQDSRRWIRYDDRPAKLEKVGPTFSSWLVVPEHAQFRDIAPLRSISLGDTLRPLYFISRSECGENKTSQKSHFVTTAEICMHPIECYSGHISVLGFGINDLLVFPLLHAIHHFDRFLHQGWARFPRFHHFINTAEWKFKWTKHNQCIARSHDGIIIVKNVLLLGFWVLTIFRIWDISVLE